tara:strand:- start:484 stop:600 length:117 start_codon:yes stop_codon:yes gene_type:complete
MRIRMNSMTTRVAKKEAGNSFGSARKNYGTVQNNSVME